MRTIKAVIKKYKTLYPNDDIKQKGSWIEINGDSFRSKDVKTMIDDYKPPTTLVDTLIELESKKAAPKIYDDVGSYDDVGMIAKEIYMKADKARHSSSKAEMRKACHDIAKLAKKIMNIQGV